MALSPWLLALSGFPPDGVIQRRDLVFRLQCRGGGEEGRDDDEGAAKVESRRHDGAWCLD